MADTQKGLTVGNVVESNQEIYRRTPPNNLDDQMIKDVFVPLANSLKATFETDM